MTANTLYHWRARVLYAPFGVTQPGITAPPHPPHGPWRRLSAQVAEADVRTGIGSVSVDSRGTPPTLGLAVFPNPTMGTIMVSFALPNARRATLELFDVAGRRVIGRDLGELGPGSHTLRLVEAGRLSPGMYAVRLNQGRETATAKVLIVR